MVLTRCHIRTTRRATCSGVGRATRYDREDCTRDRGGGVGDDGVCPAEDVHEDLIQAFGTGEDRKGENYRLVILSWAAKSLEF